MSACHINLEWKQTTQRSHILNFISSNWGACETINEPNIYIWRRKLEAVSVIKVSGLLYLSKCFSLYHILPTTDIMDVWIEVIINKTFLFTLVKKCTRYCSSAEKCHFTPCIAIFFSAMPCSAIFSTLKVGS